MTTNSKILKKSQFGACTFSSVSPSTMEPGTPALNVVFSIDEALKLNLGIDECVRKLGRYNRATSTGKNAALSILIHLDKRRIRILESKLRGPTSRSIRSRAKTRAPG
jgi:hypothetical protein